MTTCSRPSAFRNDETMFWSDVPAVRGGSPSQRTSSKRVGRDDPVRVQEQEREEGPLLLPAERDGPTVAVDDLERTQEAEIQHCFDL